MFVVLSLCIVACADPPPAPDHDVDGDGVDAAIYGGGDCDDHDPNVYPGAQEVWYDGANSNCDLASDFDQDGDGHDALDAFGDDCDDLDPEVLPGAEEQYDGADNDCDGLGDDGLLVEGVLRITEVMSVPTTEDVRMGQWIEVLNTGTVDVVLGGWALQASDEGPNLLPEVRVAPNARVVLGATNNSAINGGISDVGVWESDTGLIAPLTLLAGELVVDVASWTGVIPEPGVSVARDDAGVWCAGTGVYGDGQVGTPGEPNSLCPEGSP